MAILDVNWSPSRRQLRQFAGLLVVFAGVVSGLMLYQGVSSTTAGATFGGAIVLGAVGWFWTGLLRAVYVVWMVVAFPIGWTVSHVVLAATFYLVFTPIGIMMKIVRYDPMRRKLDRDASTYWQPKRSDDDKNRYFKQF